jgi:hypothetical protein
MFRKIARGAVCCTALGLLANISVADSPDAPGAQPAPDTTAAPNSPAAPTPSAAPTTQPEVTLINLHMPLAMPRDVFDAIAKQSGVHFNGDGDLWKQDDMQVTQDIDLTDQPFWPAVMEVCQRYNISIQTDNTGDDGAGGPIRLMLDDRAPQGRDAKPYPQFVSNGELIQATSIQRVQQLDYQRSASNLDQCTLQMTACVDPAIHLLVMHNIAHLQSATDNLGHSLLLPQNGNSGGSQPNQRVIIFDCQIPLAYPSGVGTSIAELKGYVTAKIASQIVTMTVAHPLSAGETDQAIGDLTIQYHSLEKTAQGYTLKLSVTNKNDDDQENGGSDYSSILDTARLLDDKGHAFQNSGSNQNGSDYSYDFTTDSPNGGTMGEPAQWTVDVPTKTKLMRIPIEFHGLPLPGK